MKLKMKKIGKMIYVFEFSTSKLGYMTIFIKICVKNFLTHFVGHFWLIEAKIKMKMKKLGKTNSIFEFSVSELGFMEIFMKIWEKKTFYSFFKSFLTNRGKNEVEDKKNWKNDLVFEFSISKLGYMAIFMKICAKNFLTLFVGHFWLIEAKMKMKMNKFGKMSSNIGFLILDYVVIFMKIWEKKNFDPFFKTFLNSIFELSISKLGCMELFIKIWEKIFFFKIFTWEGHTRTEVSKGLSTWCKCF